MDRLKIEQIETQSPRLILRELREADCSEAYVSWLRDPSVVRFLETRWLPEQTLESVISFVREISARSNEFLFGMFLKDGEHHIGNIKVGPVHQYHACADVSLFIGEKDCWGKGYAGEAIEAISRLAFDRLAVEKLSASMYRENTASMNAFLKVGYACEGAKRSQYILEEARSDIIILGLLKDELA